jgi:hypothetical protein
MHEGLLEARSVLLGITGTLGIPVPVLIGHDFPNAIRASSGISNGEVNIQHAGCTSKVCSLPVGVLSAGNKQNDPFSSGLRY